MKALPRIHVICAGGHESDRARLALLQMLAKDDRNRTTCAQSFADRENLSSSDLLITYIDDMIPTPEETDALRLFLENGGRWLALHATTAIVRLKDGPVINHFGVMLPGPMYAPDIATDFMKLIGARFIAHLPPVPFHVRPTGVPHPVVDGIAPFDAFDEGYMLELYPGTEVLLESRYTGTAPEYYPREWPQDDPRPIMTHARRGKGAVLYLTLGHLASRFCVRPLADAVPELEVHCSWHEPAFQDLLERSIAWGLAGAKDNSGPSTFIGLEAQSA